MGIMEEIKGHLQSGKTVAELKEMGFKAPSIYKVNKQLKDDLVVEDKPGDPKPEPFQESSEVKKVPETTLETNPIGPNNSGADPDPDNILDNQETKGEPLIEELFGDDKQPFRDFNEVDINKSFVDINPDSGLFKSKTKIADTETGKLGVAELIAQVYSLIGITTGHDHWEVSPKEQKVLKHLCKIPVLESALHKFGLYGCVISLITMTLKRIKIEMQLKKQSVEDEIPDQGNGQEVVVRPDSPGTVMGLFEQ